jgi:hypothetical protein
MRKRCLIWRRETPPQLEQAGKEKRKKKETTTKNVAIKDFNGIFVMTNFNFASTILLCDSAYSHLSFGVSLVSY